MPDVAKPWNMSKACAFWFIRHSDGQKLIQCSKEEFDLAIAEGKSVKYGCYANRKKERIAEQLERSRMAMLAKTDLPLKLRVALTDPVKVIDVQIVTLADPDFWVRESKRVKFSE
jgi:hypothetical protein